MSDVNDLPVWADCPFRDRLPSYIAVRRGWLAGFQEQFIVLHAKFADHEYHIDMIDDGDYSFDRVIKPAINNLAGAIFDDEHPGQYPRMIKNEARAGGVVPQNDAPLWARLRELSGA